MTEHGVSLRVNGTSHELRVPFRRMLVDTLRDELGLTGTKEGCGIGVCGACTVLLDGEMISSCLTPTVLVNGHDILTIEGLADGDEQPRGAVCRRSIHRTRAGPSG